MESLLVALNAVIPFLCYISFGYIVRMKKIVSESFLQQLNQMVFRLFYPCMTFYNIYKADAEIKKMLDEGSKEEKSAD